MSSVMDMSIFLLLFCLFMPCNTLPTRKCFVGSPFPNTLHLNAFADALVLAVVCLQLCMDKWAMNIKMWFDGGGQRIDNCSFNLKWSKACRPTALALVVLLASDDTSRRIISSSRARWGRRLVWARVAGLLLERVPWICPTVDEILHLLYRFDCQEYAGLWTACCFFIVTSMSGLMRNITQSDDDDCLLMMCTRAMLSICKIIFFVSECFSPNSECQNNGE